MEKLTEIYQTVAILQLSIHARLRELAPQVGEAKCLQEMLEVVEKAIEERDHLRQRLDAIKPAATKKNVQAWANVLDFDDVVKTRDLADAFDLSANAAHRHMGYLVGAGVLEKWGRGGYRRKPARAGSATLHVVSAGITKTKGKAA